VSKGLDFPIFLHDDGSTREVVKILWFHFFSDSFGGFHTYVIFLILLHLFSVCSIYDPWRGRGRGGGRCGKKEAWQRSKRASRPKGENTAEDCISGLVKDAVLHMANDMLLAGCCMLHAAGGKRHAASSCCTSQRCS